MDCRPVDLVLGKHPGFFQCRSVPFLPGRQDHDGIDIGFGRSTHIDTVSMQTRNDRRKKLVRLAAEYYVREA